MAACQSPPLCAPAGLLLLLIGVLSSQLPEVWSRPTDFWCNPQDRRMMQNRIEGLKKDVDGCVGSDKLAAPVQLPCVWVRLVEWKNKTLQRKHAEVIGALQIFQDGVQGARKNSTSQCQTSLLKRLEHHIKNHLAIVSLLQIQDATVTSSHSAVQHCRSQTRLKEVLDHYMKLLKGKLEYLADDLTVSVKKNSGQPVQPEDNLTDGNGHNCTAV